MQNDHVLWILYEERRRDLLVEAASSRLLSHGSFDRNILSKSLLSGLNKFFRIPLFPHEVARDVRIRVQ